MSAPPFPLMQQPLAFTIVKTVVTARDEARALPPNVDVAWKMLRGELDGQALSIAETVSWGPEDRDHLRTLIQGVGDCFAQDARLEHEFATLLDESERLFEVPSVSSFAPDVDEADAPDKEAVKPSPLEASAAEIPMIELSPELEADLPIEAAVPQIAIPPADERIAQQMPVYAPLDRSADPAPSIPSNLNPSPRASASTSAPLIAVGVVVVVALLAALGYWLFSGGDAEPSAPELTTTATALPNAPGASTPAISPAVKASEAEGDFTAARDAQRDYTASLETAAAPAEVRAEATAAVAELSLLAGDPDAAVIEQRTAIQLTKQAFGEESAEAADQHLAMVSYYVRIEKYQMAEGHYRQARKLLRNLPDALTDSRVVRLQQLGDQLGIEN